MKNKKMLLAMICATVVMTSCDEKPNEDIVSDFSSGVYIVNEGAFMSSNASVSHVTTEGKMTTDPYYDANGVPLGDVLTSFVTSGSRGYAVLNGSGRVEVVNLKDFKNLATVDGFDYPRHLAIVSDELAVVTDGSMEGSLRFIDLNSNTVVEATAVGKGPEGVFADDQHIFVCNSGGWTLDSTVSVIDVVTRDVVETIEVGHRPVQMVQDIAGNGWVLCSGETYYDADWNVTGHSHAALYKIDMQNFTVLDSFQLGESGDHPMRMAISGDGNKIYVVNHGIYEKDVTGPGEPTLLISGEFQAIGVHPVSGDIWTAGISDFVNPSAVRRHDSNGNPKSDFEAGIGAGAFGFK
ncbi:MAG: hypothetical protein JNM00_15330 [Flavobacteriales bacterium]|nr:hypothetical protein [Flavobacteriales bacterium]